MVIELDSARDQALIRRIRAGERAALAELFERYAPIALGLARRVTGDAGLAEDVVQYAFLAVWERPATYRSDLGTVRTYLFSVVHHRAVDRVRRESAHRRRLEREATLDTAAPRGVEDEVADALDSRQQHEQIQAALGGIPEEQRRIIEMMYFRGMPQSKVADELGVPLGTVKSRARLAMRKLHEALGGGDRA
ncbi:MAG: sigma-70 family RNA polymerase sigma factor [Mycobacteriales bacterium]